MGPKTVPCGTPQVKPVGLKVVLPVLTVRVLRVKYEANHVSGTPDRQRFLIDESAICCGQLYRKLHSSLAAPSMMLGDYQRLLADRFEFSAMPSLCCDLFCRLIVLSQTGPLIPSD